MTVFTDFLKTGSYLHSFEYKKKKEGKKGSRETYVTSFFFWILDIKL